MFEPETVSIDQGVVVSLFALVIVLTIAVYLELKESRIPNWLTFPAMLTGLAIGYLRGDGALGSSVGGLLIGFGFLFMFYVFGGVGGGDVKLMGAVGALVGLDMIVPALFYTAFVGGFMGIMMLIWRKEFWGGISRSVLVVFGRKGPAQGDETSAAAISIPYGVAIATGSVLAIFLK